MDDRPRQRRAKLVDALESMIAHQRSLPAQDALVEASIHSVQAQINELDNVPPPKRKDSPLPAVLRLKLKSWVFLEDLSDQELDELYYQAMRASQGLCTVKEAFVAFVEG